jgi:DNA-binding XRE family transcriptional regulator
MATPPPIGLKIKRARERLRMTQVQLGDAIGVSQKTIDNWEHDKRYPKSSIGAIEAVLGISLDGEPPPRRIVDAHTRSVLRAALPDDDDFRRVIGLMEGTLTWPAEQAPGAAGTQEGRSG